VRGGPGNGHPYRAIDRRAFIGEVFVGMLPAPLIAMAQQPATIPRIGFLSAAPLSSITARSEAFRQGLRDLGYVEGRNITIDWRSADDQWDRLPALAVELVGLKVSLIVTAEEPAALASRKVTQSIPIVMAQSGDPVVTGLAASLARPGGNVTGLTTGAFELPSKEVGLLREAVPKLSRLAVLSNPGNPPNSTGLKSIGAAARALSLSVSVHDVRDASALAAAFAAMTEERADGLIVLPDPMFLTQRAQIAELAARARLPAIYGIPEHVRAGGLMSYAADRTALFRQAATCVDKILKGVKPADLPVEQPTKFELAINLKTAKALGLTIPQPLLLRADEVIQ
jgi:putative ABC transport system substrate-binding protein